MLCQMEAEGGAGGSIMDLALALSNSGVDVPEGADEATIIGLALQFVKSANGGGDDEEMENEGGEEAHRSWRQRPNC